MSQQPAVYNAGAGYPVNQEIDGNLKLTDPSATGLYGNLTVPNLIKAGAFEFTNGSPVGGGILPVVYMDELGADNTGLTDATAIFTTALSKLPLVLVGGITYPYGVIAHSAGSYKYGSAGDTPTVGPFTWITGQGRFATRINYYGPGSGSRCFQIQNPMQQFSIANLIMGGGVTGLTIDGSNAGAGAIGLMYGDMSGTTFDAAIQHFNLAGSIGFLQQNSVWCSEKNRGYFRLIDNTIGAQFTPADGPSLSSVTVLSNPGGGTITFTLPSAAPVSWLVGSKLYGSAGLTTPETNSTSTMTISNIAGLTLTCVYTGTQPSGTTGTLTLCQSTNSHDYSEWHFSFYTTQGIGGGSSWAGQDGVQFANGANPSGCRIFITGNFTNSGGTWSGTAPAMLHLTGSMPAQHGFSGATYINDSEIQIQAEGDGSGSQIVPILFTGAAAGGTAHGITGCHGGVFCPDGTTADVSLGSAPCSIAGDIRATMPTLNRALVGYTGASGTGAGSFFDSGRPVDSAGRAYQQITGLIGANNPYTFVGGVNGAQPASGTFKVNDLAFDLTNGGYWLCTAAGTPGSWAYFGAGTATLPQSSGALATNVTITTETTVLTTGSLSPGVWLITATIVLNQTAISTFTAWESRVNGGTASYTLLPAGTAAAAGSTPVSATANYQTATVVLTFLASVTSAGTIIITAKNASSTGTLQAVTTTPVTGYAATSYGAVQVAP